MTLLQTWIDYVAKTGAGTETGPEDVLEPKVDDTAPAAKPFYFASTSLDLRQTGNPGDYPRDIYIEHVCYRRIDPPYFAWLRSRLATAKRTFESGRLTKAKWDELRGRFNRLQEWAIGHYGKDALQAAIHNFNPAGYTPPVNRQPEPFFFPQTGDWKFAVPVTPDAIRKVDAIREAARAMGWSDERLYQNRGRFRFPFGQDYGLVCFVNWDHELGAVAEMHIEIIHTRSHDLHVSRFYNSDVFPPSIEKADGAS